MPPSAADKSLPARRRSEHRRAPALSLLRRITRRSADGAPDPVSLAVLAIDRVRPGGGARLRLGRRGVRQSAR
jgi:hypothetical protein